jgi:hypothetical protein
MSTQIVTLISEDECIGDSLETINNNFSKIDTLLTSLSATIFSAVNSVKTVYVGNGITAVFSVEGGVSLNASDYRVSIDGVLQEPDVNYIVSINQITFTTAPPSGSKIVIITSSSIILQ